MGLYPSSRDGVSFPFSTLCPTPVIIGSWFPFHCLLNLRSLGNVPVPNVPCVSMTCNAHSAAAFFAGLVVFALAWTLAVLSTAFLLLPGVEMFKYGSPDR